MRKVSILGAVLLVFGFVGCSARSHEGKAEANPERKKSARYEAPSQDDRARFGRLADTFVAKRQLYGGAVAYYTQPKPYGSWLCRVDVVTLPGWIAAGRSKPESEFWEDDLDVRRFYGAWRSPRENETANRMEACRGFRRFEGLFLAEGSTSPERYIYLLDQLLLDLANDGSAGKVTCLDKRKSQSGVACNAKDLLGEVSIYTPFSAATRASREVAGGQIYSDSLSFDFGDVGDHPAMLTIEFESKQTFGKQSSAEADIESAKIVVEVL